MFHLLKKEDNISSYAATKKFAKENNIIKIGHSGTLDPLASGYLLLADGDDTKLFNYVHDKSKKYHVVCALGFQTDTFDIEGKVINRSTKKCNSQQEILKIVEIIKKNDYQKPPIFSAKKINGQKAYNLARKGHKVVLDPVKIKIHSVTNVNLNVEKQIVSFDAHVSNGTYIRSIVNDLGLELGTYATMTALDRYEISGLSGNLTHFQIINILFKDRLIFTTKDDVIRLQKNHFNHIVKLSWYLDIINTEKDYILVDKDTNMCYGVISVANKLIKIKRLFGKRLQ
ncbi:tRNA pseudouridine synthase B [Mycoplasmopsis californica]|uniref:tRNA pseudouridine(55) synthase n=1 Tax=Mycoplasmopsis equigenitalium TaxID=114883 RepID=A0ABY5J0E2_9BACT|nr:tRNA pseudouridine(55) synthase TruB [Mycoplasmopsis equigenitalium]UUD36732.1 tRNA pseudouridine(55) synthase TruB [Mycoplasmopsis equigenitalium]VEU69974.1 tRNA pseudouridine synthase B [Mycoplasmopsis californica]